eukprot:SAG22_NODE_3395_length_1734_cov_5.771413_1_plen_32_part_10
MNRLQKINPGADVIIHTKIADGQVRSEHLDGN